MPPTDEEVELLAPFQRRLRRAEPQRWNPIGGALAPTNVRPVLLKIVALPTVVINCDEQPVSYAANSPTDDKIDADLQVRQE